MSAAIYGNGGSVEVKIAGNYFPFGCFTSFAFNFNNELILKTDVNAGLFRKRRVRISDCSASVSGLTTLENDTSASSLHFLQEGVRRTEQDLRFTFTDQDGVSKQIQGIFLVENVTITGAADDFSECDIVFQGTGGVTVSTVDESPSSDLPDNLSWDWWETTPGGTSITGPGHYGRSFAGLPAEDIIEVDREGLQYDLSDGAPVGREAFYDSVDTIEFDPDNPFIEGTRVFVIWKV